MKDQTIIEGKTIAIISHITIIGTVAALIMNSNKKNSFANFHIRQMIGLSLLGLLNQYVIRVYLGANEGMIIAIALFIFRVIGFLGALKGEEKKIPLLGDQFQDWFKNI